MKRPLAFSQTSSPHSQRGIATVLIVVLIGVALTATAMGIMHSMRSSQEKHVAVHAATNAQIGAWAGVEAFRLYLDSQGVGGLANGGTYPISLDGYGTMTAKDINITETATGHRVGATIVNVQDAAHSSAAVGVMYEITPPGSGEYQLSAPLNFNDDLKLTSRLVFDNPKSINVKGNVNISADVTNLDAINATGSVTISSSADLGVIHSNSDVTLSGTNASATEIKSRGNVTLTGSAGSPLISANGNVTHLASTNTNSLRSRSNVTIGGSGNHALITAGGGVTINSSYGGTVTNLWSVDTIANNSSSAQLSNIYGEKNLNCLASWSNFSTIAINGTLGSGCLDPSNPAVTQNAAVTVNVMNPVPPFNMPSLAVDVYPLREEANYAVSYDGENIRVEVNNVYGLANGTYYVGQLDTGRLNDEEPRINIDRHSPICPVLNADGKCPVSTSQKYLCIGYSDNEGCFSYVKKSFTFDATDPANPSEAKINYHSLPTGAHASKGTFIIAGTGIAPGIWWIDGNVVFSNGFNNGTILVTGNIATSNHYRGAAVNYGGEPVVYSHTIRSPAERTTPYQEICEAIGTGMKAEGDRSGDYRGRFENQYPTNLCDKGEGIYTPHRLGNIALAAGGLRTEAFGGPVGTYTGGDIHIKSNSNLFGIVLAGNYFEARDNVAIMGFVSASVQGTPRTGEVKNLTHGDVKIYTDSETEWYSPNVVPWMGADPCTVGCGTGGTTPGAKVLWSRYL